MNYAKFKLHAHEKTHKSQHQKTSKKPEKWPTPRKCQKAEKSDFQKKSREIPVVNLAFLAFRGYLVENRKKAIFDGFFMLFHEFHEIHKYDKSCESAPVITTSTRDTYVRTININILK